MSKTTEWDNLLVAASPMLEPSSLENVLIQEGYSEGEYDHMVCFLCYYNYLVPPCRGVVS